MENNARPVAKPVGRSAEPLRETGFYEPYGHFSRTLRLWFIAYGVGAPVLLLNNQAVVQPLLRSGWGQVVAYGFMAGVALQILAAVIFKGAMWYLYLGEMKPSFCGTRRYKASEWLSECFALEAVADVATLFVFSWATYRAIGALTP